MAPARPWTFIQNWVYWLDGPDLDAIARTAFELAVIDPSADGTAEENFSAGQIAALRGGGCARRVVAYLNIGQAEDYRSYWQDAWAPGNPGWIIREDPDWPGDYFVRFWDPGWQAIAFQRLDDIVAAGFDGVYLDRIDACFESYAEGHEADMIAFVGALAARARGASALGDDFGVIAQNAEELVAEHPDYVATLTGLAREEVYVRATDDATSSGERADTERLLDIVREQSRAGLVLTVDYATKRDLIEDAYARSRDKGYVPYVTDVDLDRLRVNPGHEPVCRDAPSDPGASPPGGIGRPGHRGHPHFTAFV